MSSQKKKVTLYFNSTMLAETQKEALRQDRSVSWIIQAAWRLARDEVRRMPGAHAPSAAGGATEEASQNGTDGVQAAHGSGDDAYPRPV